MIKKLMDIVCHTHYFKCINITAGGQTLINAFAKRYVQYGMLRKPNGKFIYSGLRVFGASNKRRSEFRFHSTTLAEFIQLLSDNSITPEQYTVTKAPVHAPVAVSMPVRSQWVLRDYQVPVVDFLTTMNNSDTKLVQLQTGRGKTLSALVAISIIGVRTALIIKATYIEKWVSDVVKILDIDPTDVMCVQGSGELRAIIDLAVADQLEAKVIIISSRTYQNYIKAYENLLPTTDIGFDYGCLPDEFFETLGVGVRLIDEVHQEAYGSFKLDMYTNVPVAISLSATLENLDAFIEQMYKVMCPAHNRYKEDSIHKYINSTALMYSFNKGVQYRTTEMGSRNYSHNMFERSLMKSKFAAACYYKMIKNTIDSAFLKDYKPGDKVAIFAASIAMCTDLTKYLKDAYFNLDVRRYVEDDPYENIIEPDIRVTTILSGGTAVDIPNLTCVIMTTSVMSVVSNKQTLGRLRPIEGRNVRFYYLVCTDIPKQVEYHLAKKEMLSHFALTFNQLRYPLQIG